MNNREADPARLDRLAIAAAPFCHPRIADNRVGKKDLLRERAQGAGQDTEWGDDLTRLLIPS